MIIAIKAKNQKSFAALMGWTPSYLSKLVTEQGMGLTPIMQILEKFKDIDARWLLFGTGYIFGDIEKEIKHRAELLLSIEKYIPVMTEEEQINYIEVIHCKRLPDYSDEDLIRWEKLLYEKNISKIERINKAMAQSVVTNKKGD